MSDRGPILEVGPILRSMKRSKIRFGLIVLEIALTLAIVVNCIGLISDARTQMMHPSGFDDDNIIYARTAPFDPAFRENGYLDNVLASDVAAIRALPGVKSVAVTRFLPWQGGGSSTMLKAAGPGDNYMRTQLYSTDEGFLDTLGTQLVEGRSFTHDEVVADTLRFRALFAPTAGPRPRDPAGRFLEHTTQDVVISKKYAELVFGQGSALGKLLEDTDGDFYRIIGVLDPFYNPYGWPIHEYVVFYMSLGRSFEGGTSLLVRTEPGQSKTVQPMIEPALLAVDKGRTFRVVPLDDIKDGYFANQRAVVMFMSVLVGLLVLVTSLGIVGLTAFSVAERTRQIGTRRALGARRVDIVRHFLLENWLLTTMGLTLGVALAFGINIGLVSTTAGTKIGWALPLAGVALLWVAGIAATLAPALRASRISPAIATRNV